jgi:uncharacterized membrane protein
MSDSRAQSLLKAVSWRVVATAATVLISYIVTHRITAAVAIGSIEFVAKIFLYYFHERLWQTLSRVGVKYKASKAQG